MSVEAAARAIRFEGEKLEERSFPPFEKYRDMWMRQAIIVISAFAAGRTLWVICEHGCRTGHWVRPMQEDGYWCDGLIKAWPGVRQ